MKGHGNRLAHWCVLNSFWQQFYRQHLLVESVHSFVLDFSWDFLAIKKYTASEHTKIIELLLIENN